MILIVTTPLVSISTNISSTKLVRNKKIFFAYRLYSAALFTQILVFRNLDPAAWLEDSPTGKACTPATHTACLRGCVPRVASLLGTIRHALTGYVCDVWRRCKANLFPCWLVFCCAAVLLLILVLEFSSSFCFL